MSKCVVFSSENDLASFLTTNLLLLAAQAKYKNKKFVVALSGGSLAKLFCEHFSKIHSDNKSFWQSWYFVFCDERYVPHDDAESTYGFYKTNFFDKMPIASENIIKLNYSLPVEEAAAAYEDELRKLMHQEGASFARLDVLLLGMGPDGHTCSLFPGHPLLMENQKWVSHLTDSPKPPPSRITLTLPLLNHALHAFVVACGASKAAVVKEALTDKDKSSLPVAMVTSGKVLWLLDEAAAASLPPQQATRYDDADTCDKMTSWLMRQQEQCPSDAASDALK